MPESLEYTGRTTDRKSAIASVERALLRHGDWGPYGDFSRPLNELSGEYKITIEERPDSFSVTCISAVSNSGFEVSFSVLKKDLSIDLHSVVIGVDCPPPEIGE
ncbi:hypothetical protein EUZ85_18760 [Hahella sp. KA22]|uniref:hypothetical protein n=1 Tax=Hahella sp. KA22 TaxID=1628392 RepID=UPI000FDF5729|nr:hypothetical protein [Hahella sp. KA22]AZZ92654.1 hypothetical protein ENC22_16185 [Hahella sp. KA22]QAY56027.1 hypothetical protein EUZ85_18760 [Hahella sp. KA22]